MSGTTTIPNVDLALLSSRLVNVASSLQGVAQDVHTMSNTPQAASADAPPWALLLMDNTEKILTQNRVLFNENQDLKRTLSKIVAEMSNIPPWAIRLLDINQEVLEESQRQSQSIDHLITGHARISQRLDEIRTTQTERTLERIQARNKGVGEFKSRESLPSEPKSLRSTQDPRLLTSQLPSEAKFTTTGTQHQTPRDTETIYSSYSGSATTTPAPTSILLHVASGDEPSDSAEVISPAIRQQWEVARSINRRAKGTKDEKFDSLAFPPGIKPSVTVPRTLAGIDKMPMQYVKALLTGYRQPTLGKSHSDLLSDYKRFIGFQDASI